MNAGCDYVLALDQGSHASRALVFDARGRVCAQAEVAVPTLSPAADFIEHDPELLVTSVQTAAALALQRAALAPQARIHAALATQRSTVVCWERDTGRPLSPAISWQDRRNGTWLEALSSRAQWIREQTGLPLSPHYGASKLRWCLDNLPDVAVAAREGRLACGPLSSFILARITRERSFLVDPANASRTQLWSLASNDWSAELLSLFGIERSWLPTVVPTAHDFGHIPGSNADVPITVISGDQSTVPYAFGALDPRTAYINMGTGAFIQRPSSVPAMPPLLTSILYSDAGGHMYAMEGTVNGAGAALRWLADTQEIDAHAIARGLTRAELNSSEPPLFKNTVSGLGSPYWRPAATPHFSADGTPESLTASVLESIAFLINENLKLMRATAPEMQRVLVTGGLARIPYLVQTLADVSGLPVSCPEQSEATARGAAALAFGDDQDFEVGECIVVRPGVAVALHRRYQLWRELMQPVA